MRVKRQGNREEKETSEEARNGANKERAACVVHLFSVLLKGAFVTHTDQHTPVLSARWGDECLACSYAMWPS